MDDKLKESISALMDDEANELEQQRILTQSADETVIDTWKRYHLVRDTLRRDVNDFQIDVSQAVSLAINTEAQTSEQDQQALDSEDSVTMSENSVTIPEDSVTMPEDSVTIPEDSVTMPEDSVTAFDNGKGQVSHHASKSSALSRYTSTRGILALAASVAFAFFFIVQSGSLNVSGISSHEVAQSEQSSPNNFMLASNAQIGSDSFLSRQPKMNENMTDNQVKRFNRYLLRHAQHLIGGTQSGFIPLARVASVNAVGI